MTEAVRQHCWFEEALAEMANSILFVEGEPSVSMTGISGDTPMHVFAWRGDVEGVRLCLEAGGDPNASGDLDETPLHVAVRSGNVEMIRLLLNRGAKPTIPGAFGTPAEMIEREARSKGRKNKDRLWSILDEMHQTPTMGGGDRR